MGCELWVVGYGLLGCVGCCVVWVVWVMGYVWVRHGDVIVLRTDCPPSLPPHE